MFFKISVVSMLLMVPLSCYTMQKEPSVKLSSSPPGLVMKRDLIRPILPAAASEGKEFDILRILSHHKCGAIIRAPASAKPKQD